MEEKPVQNGKAVNSEQRPWLGWAIFGGTAFGVLALGLLFASVMERRQEARILPPVMPVDALESDSSEWGVNWPRQYSSYLQTADDTTRTKYAGGYPRDYLDEVPANIVLFAGYGFSKEYLQGRGHMYALEDVKHTDRMTPHNPATCWTCKSSDVPRVMAELGAENVANPDEATFEELVRAGAGDFYGHNFHDFHSEMNHPVGCLDCHDPDTMRLRITRPALIEAFERQGKDIQKVSHQEMRSLVCAQCHVEYYFGENDYLVFPWDDGMSPEGMEKFFDRIDFTDWVHPISKAPMIKMQHPDYEVYATGIHAYRNVSCADCHMPYRTEGGMKFTDHHIQSPLLNVENSCQVCHRWSEREIISRVESIQDKVREGRNRAERAISLAHFDVAAAMQAGATDEELAGVRDLIRKAQLRWDYVAANNGMGFHNPGECQRILNAAVDLAQECRVEAARILARYGHTDPVLYPDFSTKEAAMAAIQPFVEGNPPDLLGTGGK